MTEEPKKAILDYSAPDPHVERQWRRILLCIALPMIGFGLARGFGNDNVLNGGVTAIGAFIVAFLVRVPR
jgi:uncharacterized membrane protein YqaE (UPF0057 family)